ncbi:hypothetical protein [Bosea sp. PAMC 26642]|uniref:hypothetical protein n=1 Tax=Bosea sp. (strain PAMC 26642) TaxID=1792307 RepID=UPI00077017FA|nr:hypothetical protein [Bosea sp. PAMC 26642]AMJ61166.1 hypothetical protein AXW83_13450 [Bosea sp. PAMC 26642]
MLAPTLEKLRVNGAVFRALRLSCLTSFTMDEDVGAYLCGIRIGLSRIEGSFELGDVIEFPIDYLPWVELPADIRLVTTRDNIEIAGPYRLSTRDEAIALVGMGEVRVENLTIEQGMIRGVAVNRVNGLLHPQMFARINGLVPRTISVEPPRLLDDGGASFQFAAQLHPADLGENGLTAEIFLVGQDAALTSIAYRRADVDDLTKRIVEFETQLSQVTKSTAFKFKTLNSDVTARMDVLQQRIDAFIEYAASFMFDRVAATEVPVQPGAAPLPPELRAKVDSFLDTIRAGSPKAAELAAGEVAPKTVAVPLRSPSYSFGWYDVEEEGGVEFRWMAGEAMVFNPQPEREVVEVAVSLVGVYGAEKPLIRAAFDTKAVNVVAERGKTRKAPWRLRLSAGASLPGHPGLTCQALSLSSMLTSSPAHVEGNSDSRMLSIAVSEVVFTYAA